MFDKRTHSVKNSIVSISQPHVQPIVLGKASATPKFEAKLAIRVVDGFAYLAKLSWTT